LERFKEKLQKYGRFLYNCMAGSSSQPAADFTDRLEGKEDDVEIVFALSEYLILQL
jgi:hypothetical protein